jgi:hypothetical protein
MSDSINPAAFTRDCSFSRIHLKSKQIFAGLIVTIACGTALFPARGTPLPLPGAVAGFVACFEDEQLRALADCADSAVLSNARFALAAANIGTWRLVRTPDPRGGPDAVSVVQTPDPSRSDIDLAGLMLRCSDRGFNVLIVVVDPFPPHARPTAKLTTRAGSIELPTTVMPPGAAITLPREVTALVNGAWQVSPELAIEVRDSQNNRVVRGVVALQGLASAVALLTANCGAH